MENMEKKQKKKKKWRDVRSALVMTLLMVAMMSTATYAWFTLSSSPTVAGMEMVATSTGGLTVSKAVDEPFVNAIKLDFNNSNAAEGELAKLVPVALRKTDNSAAFYLPGARDNTGNVTALEGEAVADLANHVAVYTYYIKSDNGDVNVGIITGNSADTETDIDVNNNEPTVNGTVVRRKMDTENPNEGAGNASECANYAIRMGLVITEANVEPTNADLANMIILEPNADGVLDNQALSARVAAGADDATSTNIPTKVVFNENGTITQNPLSTSPTTSKGIFSVGETPVRVTMYYWLEGVDPQCVDEIKTDQIESQIQFTVVDEVIQ